MFIICLYYVVVLLIISSIGSGSQFMGTIDGINKLLNQELRFQRFASFAVIFFSCFLFEFILQVFCLCFVITDSCDFGITNPYKPFSSKLLWSWHFIKRWKSKGYISSLLFICPPFLSPPFFTLFPSQLNSPFSLIICVAPESFYRLIFPRALSPFLSSRSLSSFLISSVTSTCMLKSKDLKLVSTNRNEYADISIHGSGLSSLHMFSSSLYLPINITI